MLSKGFKIVSPKTFEIDIEDVNFNTGDEIVKIEHAAICKADLRYYLGNRDKRILGLKYPMRLIHEATGTILKSNSGEFNIGDKVILAPNICKCDICDFKYANDNMLGTNYCPKAKFASSNYDGFSTEIIAYPSKNIVRYDDNIISSKIAVFSELITVAISAIRRVNSLENKTVGIWGDGIVGYILAHVIKSMYKTSKVVCVGKNKDKLDKFNVDEIYMINTPVLNRMNLDVAFECVGGDIAENAINEMIESLTFGGDIVLTGVSENGARLNTRRILEKAIRITGSTRSTVDDFKKAVELLNDKDLSNQIEKLVLSENIVENISDYYAVFEKEVENNKLGKNIIRFNL